MKNVVAPVENVTAVNVQVNYPVDAVAGESEPTVVGTTIPNQTLRMTTMIK